MSVRLRLTATNAEQMLEQSARSFGYYLSAFRSEGGIWNKAFRQFHLNFLRQWRRFLTPHHGKYVQAGIESERRTRP